MARDTDQKGSGSSGHNSSKLLSLLVPTLFNVVNISALLTVLGFFTVHSYLASFSTLFSYNISVTQYLSAGINLVLTMIWYIVVPILSYAVLGLVVLGFMALLAYVLSRNKRINQIGESIFVRLRSLFNGIKPVIKIMWAMLQAIATLLFVASIALVGFVYGTFHYSYSPRMLGGGAPSDVILVFREDQPIQNPIWPFPINPTNPRQSEQVQLLLEFTDGVLVRHSLNNVAVIVKNDVIQGIIDVSSVNNSATSPTITPTPIAGTATP
jgi:hypothetical protein